MSEDERPPSAQSIVGRLRNAPGELVGRFTNSSNYTFLVRLDDSDVPMRAVYKPEQGEMPLSDFPPGLYRREAAAYELARALGWPNIPETVIRDDLVFGVGSLQRFIDADFEQHYFTLPDEDWVIPQIQALATFDVISNNADRKAGHCLIQPESHKIWAIDNGLSFSEEPKLRTVIWDLAQTEVPAELVRDIAQLVDDLPTGILGLLSKSEIEALRQRIRDLVEDPVLPELVSQRQYPWPLI